MKRLIRRLFEIVETFFSFVFGQQNNPLYCLGALGWFFFWICAGSGVYLYLFFDTGITDAYASVEYITNDQWFAAGIMRSLHRYASDALVVIVFLHILREFSYDRLRGKRFFAWLTGVPLLAFIYVCGISGYWLVWDQLAQFIAITTSEWIDALPFFGEPIANNFLNSTTLSGRFFTLLVFIHIFAPLFMLFLMWLHIQRHSNARVNPPRPLMLGTGATLLIMSLIYPAVSQGPANLDVVPTVVNLDWFYLAMYPLMEMISGGQLWLIVVGAGALLAALPWMPPAKPPAAAIVSLENCNGCARCFDDCPYGAIAMVPRSDGRAFDAEAIVNADHCLSCGICAGACPTSTPFRRAKPVEPGIQLPQQTISDLRDRTVEVGSSLTDAPRILVFTCDHSDAASLADGSTGIVSMPCVGMLPPSFIDFAMSRGIVDGILIAGCAKGDCYFRLGNKWTDARIAGTRDPYLRKRVPLDRLSIDWQPNGSLRQRKHALAGFREQVGDSIATDVGQGND